MKRMFVYIITNKMKTVLYTGVTNNLQSRQIQHTNCAGDRKKFTGRYLCHFLLYFEEFDGPNAAIRREKEIKGWTRAKKVELIRSTNPNFDFLDPF